MTASSPVRLAGVVDMTPRGLMLIEGEGMRWRLVGDVIAAHLIGKPVTFEGTIVAAAITAYYLAPARETSPC
ncbi:DUF5818 domain-containing protein [Sphingobium yanoikuyae]|uniref:DUF5818 domain-containing protein n=1 Tax=Sphingobium yanoikuyae TaxID=13690 RepID=UPI000262C61A|nr:DUF5818 domain-containing protein [Sphingobium yanoikuyae]